MVETESKGSGAVAGLSDGRASASAPSPASAPVPEYQDIDSEELEALEDLADEEDDDDDAIERLLDEGEIDTNAAYLTPYPESTPCSPETRS